MNPSLISRLPWPSCAASASPPRRRGRDRPPRASPPPPRTPTIRAPRVTRLRTSSGLSLRGSPELHQQRAVRRSRGRDERRGRQECPGTSPAARAVRGRRAPSPCPCAVAGAAGVSTLQQRAAHDPDPVAQPLRLVEVVGAHHDRAPRSRSVATKSRIVLAADGSSAARRLVEVDHLRLVEQRAGDRDLLAHPLAEAADLAVARHRPCRRRRDIGPPPRRSVAPRSP